MLIKRFSEHSRLLYLMGVLNSNTSQTILSATSPTINCESGQIANIPIIFDQEDIVTKLVEDNVNVSEDDWDSFEISWNFKKHPLI